MSPSSGESRPSSASFSAIARLERAVAPFADRFSHAPAVLALRESLPIAFGVVLAVLVILVLDPLPPSWSAVPGRLRDAIPSAFAFSSFAMALVLAARLARRLGYPVLPTAGAALLALLFAMPREALQALAAFIVSRGAHGTGAFGHTLGASGLFTAIVVALATAGGIALGRRRFGPYAGTLAGTLGVLAASCVLFMLHVSLAGTLALALAPLARLGDSFGALVAITAIESALWVVGIHGPALLAAIVLPVYTDLQFQNTAAAHAHQPLPHLVAVSTFLFVFPGGAGATLPMVLLLLRSRVPRLRKIAYATLVPSLLNANEPVMFGLPVAFNPILAVPFVVAPTVLAIVSWLALDVGFVRAPIYYVPSTVPVLLNVFLATFDWRACVLGLVNVALAGAIWLPFVRVYERAEAARARVEAAA